MSNILKAFVLEDASWDVRILHDENGKPWFCANDVGAILEIRDVRTSTRDFDETEKVRRPMRTPGGPQEMMFLTKDGLFRLLMHSRKPIAKPFQKWVCRVLDEIEETGKYELQRSLEEEARAMKASLEAKLEEEKRKTEEAVALTRHKTLLESLGKHTSGVYVGVVEPDPSSKKTLVKIGSSDDIAKRVRTHVSQYSTWVLVKAWSCGEYRQFESCLVAQFKRLKFEGVTSAGLHHNEVFAMGPTDLDDLISYGNKHISKYQRYPKEVLESERSKDEIQKFQLQVQLEQLRMQQQNPQPLQQQETTVEPQKVAYKMRAVTRGPKVQRYSSDGLTLIKTYVCYLDATRDPDLHELAPSTTPIKEAIKGRTVYKGFRWAALGRDLPDDTVQNIGDTVESIAISSGLVAALNLDRSRIEQVFADQKDAAEKLHLNGLASVSMALKRSGTDNPRMTRGLYLQYWRDCSQEMRDAFIERGGVLPEARRRFNAIEVVATNVITGETQRFTSVAAAQTALKVGRATIFDCAKSGYALPCGVKLSMTSSPSV